MKNANHPEANNIITNRNHALVSGASHGVCP